MSVSEKVLQVTELQQFYSRLESGYYTRVGTHPEQGVLTPQLLRRIQELEVTRIDPDLAKRVLSAWEREALAYECATPDAILDVCGVSWGEWKEIQGGAQCPCPGGS